MHYVTIPVDVSIDTGKWAKCPHCDSVLAEDKVITIKYSDYIDSRIHDIQNSKTVTPQGAIGNSKGFKAVLKLDDLFEGVKAGDVIAVEDADWEILKKSVETPTGGFNSRIMKECISFMDSILEAPTEDPNKVEEEEEPEEEAEEDTKEE